MNKEFIPYEQALALKELGFDEPVLKPNKSLPMYHLTTLKKALKEGGGPTFSQAFKWFREKHKLFAPVTTNGLGQYDFRIGLEWSGRIWDTYEEAELACLNKLIELVKKKQ